MRTARTPFAFNPTSQVLSVWNDPASVLRSTTARWKKLPNVASGRAGPTRRRASPHIKRALIEALACLLPAAATGQFLNPASAPDPNTQSEGAEQVPQRERPASRSRLETPATEEATHPGCVMDTRVSQRTPRTRSLRPLRPYYAQRAMYTHATPCNCGWHALTNLVARSCPEPDAFIESSVHGNSTRQSQAQTRCQPPCPTSAPV